MARVELGLIIYTMKVSLKVSLLRGETFESNNNNSAVIRLAYWKGWKFVVSLLRPASLVTSTRLPSFSPASYALPTQTPATCMLYLVGA